MAGGSVDILLDYAVDPHRVTTTERGSFTQPHLAVAGPSAQFLTAGLLRIIDILLQMGVDANAKDHEGWTVLHIAASWGICDLQNLFSHSVLDWSVLTNDRSLVDDLFPVEQFFKAALHNYKFPSALIVTLAMFIIEDFGGNNDKRICESYCCGEKRPRQKPTGRSVP